MKKSLAFLLVLALAVCMLPGLALAEEAPAFDLTKDLEGITIPDDLVTCTCTTTNESKKYGQLPNGLSASVAVKEGEVWTVIIYVQNSVYKAQFEKDTGSTHATDNNHVNDFDPPIQFKLKYEGNKWVLDGEMPKDKTLHFTCNGNHTMPKPDTFPGVITVKKTVESNDPADKDKEFNFKVTVITDPNPDTSGPPIAKSANAVKAPAARGVDKTATKADFKLENGIWTLSFTLKDGDTMTISNLPVGFIYRVDELDAAGYTVTVNNETTSSKDVGLTKENPTETLNFKNTRGSTPTPTPTPYNSGGHGHYHPDPTPVPVVVIPPKTGDMTLLQYIARLLGLVR
jgi:hypothetical protein